MKTIYVKDWGILPKDQKENTYQLRCLLESIRGQVDVELIFEEGTYHFYPDYAVEKLLYISNHDEDTIKKIAFDLQGIEGLLLKGQNTEFLFHSEIIPFHIHQSKRVKICGIHIDYARQFYSQAIIEKVEERRAILNIDRDAYPFFVRHGRLFFTGEGFCSEMTHGCLEMDRERMAPVYNGKDISFNLSYGHPREGAFSCLFGQISEKEVEVLLTDESQSFLGHLQEGNVLILRHHARTHPAFYVTESSEIELEDITLYHCGGMALITQFTEHITLRRFHVMRHPKKQQYFTATADGFHFVYCRGLIHIQDCLVENQLDDPINIHGIYGRIHRILSDREVLAELVEGMQKGVQLGRKGDRFAVIERETLLEKGSCTVDAIEMLNKDFMKITFNQLPAQVKEGDAIENVDYIPDVLIEGCTFRNNRARGALLTSAGNVVVRENQFETAGAAILIEGDCNYWFESGAVKQVTIEGNCFKNCAYVPAWGEAPIQISPQMQEVREGEFYHGHIAIKRNLFYSFDERVLWAKGVKEIDFIDNEFIYTKQFPPIDGQAFELEHVQIFRKE